MLQTGTAKQQQQLERGITAVFNAGQGAMTLLVIGNRAVNVLVAEVMTGDPYARTVLQAVDRLLRKIERRSRANALPCLLCDSGTLWRGEAPAAVAVLLPYGVMPAKLAVGMALCADCVADRAELELAHAAVARFRAGMMPDLRTFEPVAQVGHA